MSYLDDDDELIDDRSLEKIPKIEELYLGPIPPVRLVKEGSVTTGSKKNSDHEPAQATTSAFIPLTKVKKHMYKIGIAQDSQFLGVVKLRGGVIVYHNEQDIYYLVEKYLEDILKALGWYERTVKLVRQQAMKGDTKAYIWIVMFSGRPLAVIEVKAPGQDNLKDPTISCQLFDYMVQLRVSYGQCEVFGITTALEDWKIHWFPDTEEFARANILPSTPLDSTQHLAYLIGPQLTDGRNICASCTYKLQDPHLTMILTSVLLKCCHASFRKLPIISSHRLYYTITKESYLWEAWDGGEDFDLKFQLPSKKTTNFKILRHFHTGADGEVVMAINSGSRLCVIKFHFDDEDRILEYSLWRELYDVPVWIFVSNNYKSGLVLPFVFHCTITPEKIVVFNFDIASWSMENTALAEDSPRFDHWKTEFEKCYQEKEWTPVIVARIAMEKLALRGYVHRDLEWRHIAVMPIVENEIIELEPVLIDLVSVCKVEEGSALDEMTERLRQLCLEVNIDFEIRQNEALTV